MTTRPATLPFLFLLAAALVHLALAPPAAAQRGRADTVRQRRLAEPQPNLLERPPGARSARRDSLAAGARPAILLTGYWPPTNEMIRPFSTDPVQNPGGWIGSDWEGRGYDVHAFFPEFSPPDCGACGQGSGDLEVDYQDTSTDFWPIADGLDPIAVVTFSRGWDDVSWEVEMNQFNRTSWVDDFSAPFQPTPTPPDSDVPGGTLRLSMLPAQAIVDAVGGAGLGLDAYICFTGDGGGFLSEFIAYHGVWYQNRHADPLAADWCVAGGHVHVGAQVSWATAALATQVTLRALIEYVDTVLGAGCQPGASYCATAPNSFGSGALMRSSGTSSVVLGNFTLEVTGAVPGQFGLFYYGPDQIQIPFGDGFRCVGAGASGLFRLHPPLAVEASGEARRPLDFESPPAASGPGRVAPLSTWNFQFWFRDPGGPGGSGFNLSDGLSATFCP